MKIRGCRQGILPSGGPYITKEAPRGTIQGKEWTTTFFASPREAFLKEAKEKKQYRTIISYTVQMNDPEASLEVSNGLYY